MLEYFPGHDMITIRENRVHGEDPRHVVWMLDRTLSVLGFCHQNMVVHGNIQPANIVMVPFNHNGVLVDFVFSIHKPLPKERFKGYNDFSAPEVVDNSASPHPAADIYSLGMSFVYLLGGDEKTGELPSHLDSRLVAFIGKMTKKNLLRRVDDAWALYHELKQLRVQLYGAKNEFLFYEL